MDINNLIEGDRVDGVRVELPDGDQLKVNYQGPDINKQAIPPQVLFYKNESSIKFGT